MHIQPPRPADNQNPEFRHHPGLPFPPFPSIPFPSLSSPPSSLSALPRSSSLLSIDFWLSRSIGLLLDCQQRTSREERSKQASKPRFPIIVVRHYHHHRSPPTCSSSLHFTSLVFTLPSPYNSPSSQSSSWCRSARPCHYQGAGGHHLLEIHRSGSARATTTPRRDLRCDSALASLRSRAPLGLTAARWCWFVEALSWSWWLCCWRCCSLRVTADVVERSGLESVGSCEKRERA